MNLFEVIPENEKKMMDAYINAYALQGHNRTASLERLMRGWAEMKDDYLYRLLGNNLILEKPFTFSEPIEYIEDRMINVLTSNYPFIETLRSFTDGWAEDSERYKRITCINCPRWHLQDITRTYTLSKNRFDHPLTLMVTNPDGEAKKFSVQKGSKVVPFIGKLVKWLGIEEGYEKFRIDHSMALNTSKLEGTLCLSIHPLDYMTMSDNESNWSSCMSWQGCGCYRAGTVEMMNSGMVLVGYFKSKSESMPMPNYSGEWNSKKWRELFIVNPELIMNIKSYPYENDELTLGCLKWIRELVEKNIGWTNFNKKFGKWDPDDGWNFGGYESVQFDTGFMYNDIEEAYTRHFYYITEGDHSEDRLYCGYSGDFICMACGEYGQPDDDGEGSSSSLVCEDCAPERYYCERCGRWEYDLEDMHYINGYYYCDSCYEDMPEDPFNEGEVLVDSDRVVIYDREKDQVTSIDMDWDKLNHETSEYMAKFCTAIHALGRVREPYAGLGGPFLITEAYMVFTDELTDFGREIVDKFCSYWNSGRAYMSSYCWDALQKGEDEFVKIYDAESLNKTCLDTQASKVKAAGKEFADFVIKTEAA